MALVDGAFPAHMYRGVIDPYMDCAESLK
jgi:hypothetical protein